MAFTQADVDALDRAIASGELLVIFGDRRVEYRSMQDLVDARSFIQRKINEAAGLRRPRQVRTRVGKGI